jgi:tRNA-2-methylthio-N6-dimethylallyladenosine synthase
MSRLYTQSEYLAKVEALRRACPGIALSTDIIVGFPGETDGDFAETMKVLRAVEFSGAFLFKYSPRPGTRAFQYTDEEVPESVQDLRLAQAQEVVYGLIARQNQALVGSIQSCLLESIDKKNRYYSGRTPEGKIVHVINAGEACVGKIIDVEITEAKASNLRGYYVGAPRFDRGTPENLSASL